MNAQKLPRPLLPSLLPGTMLLGAMLLQGCAHQRQTWTFAVSGDSRDCGNTVMPAIARQVHDSGAGFYWHLGDLRKIHAIDFDFAHEQRFAAGVPSKDDYLRLAWPDFLEHQVTPFGGTPFFLGIGNHETVPPKTRTEFRAQFADLLDRPELHAQRLSDDEQHLPASPADSTYYHWVIKGVDFINLDNASGDSFDARQLRWFDAVIDADLKNPAINSIVVGMHEALPYSLAGSHSMCGSETGIASGDHVYRKLAAANGHKRIYILASHSHYFLANVYNTGHWRDPASRARVLPGWVVGSAGAERNALPPGTIAGPGAQAHVYGYLIGSVTPDGRIEFAFHRLTEADLQRARLPDFSADIVHACFEGNPDPAKAAAAAPIPDCPVAQDSPH